MKYTIIILLTLIISGCTQNRNFVITGDEGKTLPNLQLLLMDSITKYDLSKNDFKQPIILFFFNPYCPYCKAETSEIVDYSKSNNKIKFIFLSNFPYASIKEFYDQYHLSSYPNIVFGQDYFNCYGTHYRIPGFPYLAVFDQNKKLKKVWLGQTSLQTLQYMVSL
jgi:thiol-disulfide isomerase/thioredoxin